MQDHSDETGATKPSEDTPLGGEGPVWMFATADDFRAVDLEAPIHECSSVDCHVISDTYRKAATRAEEAGRVSELHVYTMMSAVTSFHFKPNEPNEAFGPMVRMEDRRTAIPDDFRGDPEALLLQFSQNLRNPALRARVNDLLWILDKSRAQAAHSALNSYVDVVCLVRNGSGDFEFVDKGADSYICVEHLQRALQFARAIGWESGSSVKARTLVTELREEAFTKQNVSGFTRHAELDLDFGVSPPAAIAVQVESLIPKEEDYHRQHNLWHIAVRAHAYAVSNEDENRCRASAAECLVQVALAGGSAMYQAHWLEKAIAELYRVPGSRDRRRELKHQLIDFQAAIPDEMQPFSHAVDVSEAISQIDQAFRNRHFMSALHKFVRLSYSPTPEKLREGAEKSIADHPMQSLFGMSVLDSDGKPAHRYTGIGEGDEGQKSAIQQQITQSESIRRTVMVGASIEPARQAIMAEHQVTEQMLLLVCNNSPFVPVGHEGLYTKGFARFFQGDMVGALHVLTPQMENSIRHVLRSVGHDVTKMNNDMTQEDLNLSVFLGRMRLEMEEVFDSAIVTDIDNVFNHRGGPKIRHRVAHGQMMSGTPFGEDAIYACWLILQLCCIPLFSHWDELEKQYSSIFGAKKQDSA